MFLGIALVFLGAWVLCITIFHGVWKLYNTGLVDREGLGIGFWIGFACTFVGSIITGIAYFV